VLALDADLHKLSFNLFVPIIRWHLYTLVLFDSLVTAFAHPCFIFYNINIHSNTRLPRKFPIVNTNEKISSVETWLYLEVCSFLLALLRWRVQHLAQQEALCLGTVTNHSMCKVYKLSMAHSSPTVSTEKLLYSKTNGVHHMGTQGSLHHSFLTQGWCSLLSF